MQRLFLLFICLIFSSPVVFAQTDKEKQVLDTEQLRFSAMTRKDTVLLNNLLAEDLAYVHSNGLLESKTEHLQSIGSGKITYATLEREPETRIRLYKKWAITNGTVHATGKLNANPFDIRLKYSAVYRKKKNTWQLVNWQSARL